jgi:hypothetical protein
VPSFLIDEKRIDLAAEEIKMATMCLDYLNLDTINTPTSNAVTNGNYGFIDYAALYWVRHIEAGLSGAEVHDAYLSTFAESMEIFLQKHWYNPSHPLTVSQRNRDRLAWFDKYPYFENILQAVVSARKQIAFFGKMKEGEIALDISDMVARIRNVLENTYNGAGKPLKDELDKKYGLNIFKCPRLSCQFFTTGFSTLADRDHHSNNHDRPFRCTEKACTGYIFGFSTAYDLEKHTRETHSRISQDEQFPTEADIQQSMQPESTTPEPPAASADLAGPEPESEHQPGPIFHPVPAQHRTRQKKRQKEYTCPHCNKVFRKKYNWTSHLLTHSTDKPFKCQHCEKDFSRATDMRRHESSHGEKTHVCFGYLRDGGSWGCGRSFARADILSSHHKVSVGFVPHIPSMLQKLISNVDKDWTAVYSVISAGERTRMQGEGESRGNGDGKEKLRYWIYDLRLTRGRV